MKVVRILTSTTLALVGSTLVALPVSAQVVTKIGGGLNAAAAGSGYGTSQTGASQLPIIIGSIISVVLQLVGVMLLGYLIYAGFLWMTAGGDKSKVTTATTTIRNAVIGLVIIVLSYAIADFVLQSLGTAVTGATDTQVTEQAPPEEEGGG